MQTASLTISNKLGVHIRAASKLVNCAQRYSSKIKMIKGEKRADAKSILSIMALGAVFKDAVILEVDGEDEVAALTALRALIEAKFHEE